MTNKHDIRRYKCMTYDIKADHNGQAVHRVAYGDLQA
nr:MAG TPA: hypothetical protein [Caudoviricetes sp.]